jgi:hypothetical protein
MARTSFTMALAAALVFFSAAPQAHLFHAGITDISFNEKTGSTEIVHTYMTHDVEALLGELYQRQFDLSQPEDEAILRKYIEKQFFILGPDQRRLPLHWVGVQVDIDSVTIYQEIEHTPLSQAARIHQDVLSDFVADQANTVNIKQGGAIRTLSFDHKTTDQNLR